MQTTFDAVQLKALLKEAVAEVLEERRDLLQNALEETLEDIALTHAIQAEELSPNVSRDEVFGVLSGIA